MPPRRPKSLSDTDREVWARYTQSVAPLDGVTPMPPPAPAPEPAGPPPVATPVPASRARSRAPPTPLEVGAAPGGVDRATWTRFHTGKLPAVRTLDLHGMTVHRAHAALQGFLAQARAEQLRCVEVITGRGSGENGGAIRREFTHWLNAPSVRPLVLAASHPHAANTGSVRLLLRRAR